MTKRLHIQLPFIGFKNHPFFADPQYRSGPYAFIVYAPVGKTSESDGQRYRRHDGDLKYPSRCPGNPCSKSLVLHYLGDFPENKKQSKIIPDSREEIRIDDESAGLNPRPFSVSDWQQTEGGAVD
jgi:hypothetical protein